MPTVQYEIRSASFAPGGRVERHEGISSVNAKISAKFRVAPSDIDNDGNPANTTVDSWAIAAGWATTANQLSSDGTPANTGCPQYRGKDGLDPVGSWRLPTIGELMLIAIFHEALQKTDGFTPLINSSAGNTAMYFSATENNATTVMALILYNLNTNQGAKTTGRRTRCISDIP